MPDQYTVEEVADHAEWDAFLATARGGNLFSSSRWLACAQAALPGRVVLLGCRRNGRLVAGVSGLDRPSRFGRRFATPDLTPHGGILCAPVAGKGPARAEAEYHRAAGLLADHLTRHYGHVHLTHTPAVGDTRPFLWAGWNVYPRYTYWLDRRDLKALWERVERRTRTAIRKAERAGYHLHTVSDLSLLEALYERVYQRQQGGPPVGAATLRRFASHVLENGLGEAWATSAPDGRPAAVVVFVREGDTVYAWVAGADPEQASSGAAPYLYWSFLRQTECTRFDFVGANMPGIAMFKRGFGGDLVPYYATEGFGSVFLRAVCAVRTLGRQLQGC